MNVLMNCQDQILGQVAPTPCFSAWFGLFLQWPFSFLDRLLFGETRKENLRIGIKVEEAAVVGAVHPRHPRQPPNKRLIFLWHNLRRIWVELILIVLLFVELINLNFILFVNKKNIYFIYKYF